MTLIIFIGVSIIVLIAAWLLLQVVRDHFKMKSREQKRQLERLKRRSLGPLTRVSAWNWPPRNKYQPGEWAGSARALERFLHAL